MIDGKVEIENGNVPEDKPTEAEENDTISPFHIPSVCFFLLGFFFYIQMNTSFYAIHNVHP